jgi:hypothetical protein
VIAASTALALGGSLAFTASASATAIPLGQTTDTSNASLYGLLNQSNTGLIQAQNIIVIENSILASQGKAVVDANFSTAYTAATSLTTSTVAEIAADVANAANTSNLEFGTCVASYLTTQKLPATSTNISNGANYCANTPSALAAAAAQYTGKIQPGIATAATSWANLNSLVSVSTTDPTDFPGGLYTVDGDMSISSSATVTAIGKPVAYTARIGVSGSATQGYVLPSGFALTFPANFAINTSLVSAEIQASQEANPPASNAIGTATVTSPEIAALVPGSKGVDNAAQVFVVATSSLTQPEFELYLGQGDYILGTVGGVTFPLTVTFGEPVVNGTATPLPVSSVTMNFPAASSPLKAMSCTDAGTLTGTMTDTLTTLASTYFGDTVDSGPIALSATPTVVTNKCAKPIKKIGVALGSGLPTGHPILKIKIRTNVAFKTVFLGVPKGMYFMRSKALAKQVSGAGIKAVRIVRGRLVIILKRKVKAFTFKTRRSLVGETKGLLNAIKRHKIKRLVLFVHGGNTPIKMMIKA